MTELRIWLGVPFTERDHAKALGCRWDPDVGRWWVAAQRAPLIRPQVPHWFEAGEHFALCVERGLHLLHRAIRCGGCGEAAADGILLAESVRHICIDDDCEEWGPPEEDGVLLSTVRHIASKRLRDEISRLLPGYRPNRYGIYRNHCIRCGKDLGEGSGEENVQAVRLSVVLPTYIEAARRYVIRLQDRRST